MGITRELAALLVCPVCKKSVVLTYDEKGEQKGLRCTECSRVYPIRDGFPVMIKDEAIMDPDHANR